MDGTRSLQQLQRFVSLGWLGYYNVVESFTLGLNLLWVVSCAVYGGLLAFCDATRTYILYRRQKRRLIAGFSNQPSDSVILRFSRFSKEIEVLDEFHYIITKQNCDPNPNITYILSLACVCFGPLADLVSGTTHFCYNEAFRREFSFMASMFGIAAHMFTAGLRLGPFGALSVWFMGICDFYF